MPRGLQLGEGQQLPAETVEVLNNLHLLDEQGQAFRYTTVKTGKGKTRQLVLARPDHVQFDLAQVASKLSEAASIVVHGVSGVLEQYEEWQEDMHQLYGEWD